MCGTGAHIFTDTVRNTADPFDTTKESYPSFWNNRKVNFYHSSAAKMWKLTFVKVAVMSFFSIDLVSSTDFSRPNIVIFLVDDLGITDLGCFGNNTIQTPNIDRLAEEGARLIHDVHPDSVCTPNRAALLTGRYTIRLGLASDIDQLRMYVRTSTSGGLPRNEITVAEIASGAGYKTGRFQIT